MTRLERFRSEMQCRNSGLYSSSYNRDCHPRGSVFLLNVHGILMPGPLTLGISRSLNPHALEYPTSINLGPPLHQPQIGRHKVIIVSVPRLYASLPVVFHLGGPNLARVSSLPSPSLTWAARIMRGSRRRVLRTSWCTLEAASYRMTK